MDPNVPGRYDPTSMGLDYNIDDTWANASRGMKLDEQVDEQGFGTLFRHTNLRKSQIVAQPIVRLRVLSSLTVAL